MTGPFEMVGDDAPVCVDGVCALPAAQGGETDEARGALGERR